MAQVTNVHIYYPSIITPVTGVLVAQIGSAFDLRKILLWNNAPVVGSTDTVLVCDDMNGTVRLTWPKTQFEVAKQASLDAGG